MNKHFIVALVSIYSALAAAAGGALAHGTALAHATAWDHEAPVPKRNSAWVGESGTASYYGPHFHGRLSASGARYDQMGLTAAHKWLPFGTKVKVSLDGTARTVVVTITDRLCSARRVVDLSVGAARQLGIIGRGIAAVTLVPV